MTRRGETLEMAVLGLLQDTPVHGYELRKQLTGVLGWGRVLSYGSLYPALKRMSRAGWITEHIPEVKPGATRRPRIVYELTADGSDRFDKLMADAGPADWEDDNFGVRFAFFSRTEREIRLRILEGRRTRLEERLELARTQLARSRRRADSYALVLQRHEIEAAEREVAWLSDLIAAERRRTEIEGRAAPGRPPQKPTESKDIDE